MNNLPINQLIANLSTIKEPVVWDDLKTELSSKDDSGTLKYHISVKEDEHLGLLFSTNISSTTTDSFISNLEQSSRSIILDKITLKPVASQYNRILYNQETLDFLKDKSWNQVVVNKCFEGTLILVFNHNNKWYVTTRRCLNAQDSAWVRNKSYYEMFEEARGNKFQLEDLNKDYCYHFILVHHSNKNIVTYMKLEKEYKELIHILTTEKYTLSEVPYTISDKFTVVTDEQFGSLEEVLADLAKTDELDRQYQKITSEGYVLKYYWGEPHKSNFTILKLQTGIYETIMKVKPNNSNIHQNFLELYQKDQLNDFLPYFTRYGSEVVRRIHKAMQTMSEEILKLYHTTRNKNNTALYNELGGQYKRTIYGIHGTYIQSRKQDFTENQEPESSKTPGNTKSINVFNVYRYLKQSSPSELKQLFYERIEMLDKSIFNFLNKGCIHTMTQSTLMFKNQQEVKSVSRPRREPVRILSKEKLVG